jgi:hypothetical protein
MPPPGRDRQLQEVEAMSLIDDFGLTGQFTSNVTIDVS